MDYVIAVGYYVAENFYMFCNGIRGNRRANGRVLWVYVYWLF